MALGSIQCWWELPVLDFFSMERLRAKAVKDMDPVR